MNTSPDRSPLSEADAARARVTALDETHLLNVMAGLAVAAGAAVMQVFAAGAHARMKADHSPVCDADEAAEEIIVAGLVEAFPEIPIVAEEASSRVGAPACSAAFFLVDPLDGTREFLNHSGDFTVNVALVLDGEPRAGVVYAPLLARLWVGSTLDPAAPLALAGPAAPGQPIAALDGLAPIRARRVPDGGAVALISRSHLDARSSAYLDAMAVAERRPMGSSLKFCVLAEGHADVYPRFAPTMEWDTAAGDAVLRAAGGLVCDDAGHPLVYGKAGEGYRNPNFVARGQV